MTLREESDEYSFMINRAGALPITKNQNYFELSCIQSIALGVTASMLGKTIAAQYGAGIAICSILVGNLILWLVSLMIISMAFENRSNAIQNVRNYLGKYGSLFMWGLLIISFINWFLLQLNSALPLLGPYFGAEKPGILLRLGAGIGFITALFASGGIRLIKQFTVMSFPAVLCYYLYATFSSGYSFASIQTWGVSASAVTVSVLTLLPGVVNYPTFFRHSQSKADSYLALTIMAFLISFFEIATIWIDFTPTGTSLLSIATLGWIFWNLICTNLLNIYYASACWEGFVPRFEGAKGYAIIGLLGTVAYTFVQVSAPILFVQNLANCYIASLGVVLFIGFLIRLLIRHRPRPKGQAINSFCWLIGCIVATILTIQDNMGSTGPLLAGIGASVVSFLCILFVEENVWAVQKMLGKS